MKNSFVNIYSFLFSSSPLLLFSIIIIIIESSSRDCENKVFVVVVRAFKEVEFLRGNFRKEAIFVSFSLSLSLLRGKCTTRISRSDS